MSFCIFTQQRHQADGTQNTAKSPMLQRCVQLSLMLNYPTQEPEDIDLLQGTYEALQSTEALAIVDDENERIRIFREIANSMTFPNECNFSVPNLFKIKGLKGCFYIAQCLFDYRYTTNKKGLISDYYEYKLVGFGYLSTDFGEFILRPESRTDRLVGKFIKTDIEIAQAYKFNEKYYLTANNNEKVQEFFGRGLINVLSKTRHVHLKVQNGRLYLSVEKQMTSEQMALIERILLEIRHFRE